MAVAFAAVAAATVLAHRWPPMNDASSHIATAVIAEALLDGEPWAHAHFTFDPAPVPYWTATGVMLALLQVLDPLASHQALFLLYLLGLPLSLVFLLRTTGHHDRCGLVAAIAVLCGFNWAYWHGESPFLIGQPLAIVAYTLFLRLSDVRSMTFVGFVVVAVLAYLSHVFALAVLAAAASSVALSALFVPRWRRANAAQWSALAIVAFLMVLAAAFIFAPRDHGATRGSLVFDPALWRLAAVVINPLDSPTDALRTWNLVFAVALALLLLTPPLYHHGLRGLLARLDLRLAVPAGALVGLSWLGPSGIRDPMGFEDISLRFTLAALLFTIAALPGPGTGGSTARRLLAFAPVALVLVYGGHRLYDVWGVHERVNERSERVDRVVLAKVPVGARVLLVRTTPYEHREKDLLHRFGNHTVLRDAYSPHVFARTGQQPLRHRYVREYRPLDACDPTPAEWEFYDYSLVEGRTSTGAIEQLGVRVAAHDDFVLYRLPRGTTPPQRDEHVPETQRAATSASGLPRAQVASP